MYRPRVISCKNGKVEIRFCYLTVVCHSHCENLLPNFVRIQQIWDVDTSLLSPTASSQMSTDAFFRHRGIHIVAGVENVLLNIAEDVLHRIIIGTPFR